MELRPLGMVKELAPTVTLGGVDYLLVTKDKMLVLVPMQALANSLVASTTGLATDADVTALEAALAGKADTGHTHDFASALDDLSDVENSIPTEGQVLVYYGTTWVNRTFHTWDLAGFTAQNLAASATTAMGLFIGSTTPEVVDPKMPRAGRVVGALLQSNAARTGGTATLQVRINGVATAFNAGAVALDATNTQRDSVLLPWTDGLPFAAGDTLGISIVSASWAPTTADLTAALKVAFAPF